MDELAQEKAESSGPPTSARPKQFDRQLHISFLQSCFKVLPSPYSGQESNKLTLVYFIVGGLDVLGALDKTNKQHVIDYIYSLQVVPDKLNPDLNADCCGFRGSHFRGITYDPHCLPKDSVPYDGAHIAMTYVGLCLLRMLGDDLSRLNKKAIARSLSKLQQADGSFVPVAGGAENDARFVYCAVAICALMEDFSGIDVERTLKFILSVQSYDFAFAQGPGQESHGGPTYCCLAALKLLGKLDVLPGKVHLIRWLCERQLTGFQGRLNKAADTCYSFWIGASLEMLGCADLINVPLCKGFSISCQHRIGGFAKWPDMMPDVLHSYFGLCGLSIMKIEEGILPLDTALGITQRAAASLHHHPHHQQHHQHHQHHHH